MIALVAGSDGFAIHRAYLALDGRGKAAVTPDKMMLGATAGGAVRMTHGPGHLLIGEGIESTLSAFILRGDPSVTAWASLSTSGMRGLQLPPQAGRLMVAPDGDKAGRAAAFVLAERASRIGWEVSILDLPDSTDLNDLLRDEVLA